MFSNVTTVSDAAIRERGPEKQVLRGGFGVTPPAPLVRLRLPYLLLGEGFEEIGWGGFPRREGIDNSCEDPRGERAVLGPRPPDLQAVPLCGL